METAQKIRIHPLAAGAAVAVIIASAVAVAAMTGHLPGSNAAPAAAQQLAVAPPPPAAPLPAVAPPPLVAEAAPACPNCGVVESVNAYRQKPRNSPVGMIGGGVLGALVGSEIGHGRTRTLTTVGGAAGGAYLGNEIGKNAQTVTRYRVVVRLDDGHTRTFTYAAQPGFSAGSHVRVENGTLMRG